MLNPHTCKKLWTKAEAAGAGSLHIRLAYSVMIPLENLKNRSQIFLQSGYCNKEAGFARAEIN
jgi:hypothetical protein